MTVAFVASTKRANSGTTPAIDTSGATLLVASASWFNTGAATISDSKGNTWVPLTAQVGGGTSYKCQLWYVLNPTVGSSHTLTLTASQNPLVTFAAFSGLDAASPFDAENGATAASGVASKAAGSITPAGSGELFVTALCLLNGTNPAIDSSYTLDQWSNVVGSVNMTGGYAYRIAPGGSAQNPSWSWTTNDGVAIVHAAFKAASGGGGTTPHLLGSLGVGA